MNIFVLSLDQKEAAQLHVDKHVVKMCCELSQLLSTAHWVLDGERSGKVWTHPSNPDIYKPTHVNHPCSKWVQRSSANYQWAHKLLRELLSEYTFRYEKIHKVEREGLVDRLQTLPIKIQNSTLTPFALAMPDEYKSDDPVQSYRTYYSQGKQHLAAWKKRKIPSWFQLQYF